MQIFPVAHTSLKSSASSWIKPRNVEKYPSFLQQSGKVRLLTARLGLPGFMLLVCVASSLARLKSSSSSPCSVLFQVESHTYHNCITPQPPVWQAKNILAPKAHFPSAAWLHWSSFTPSGVFMSPHCPGISQSGKRYEIAFLIACHCTLHPSVKEPDISCHTSAQKVSLDIVGTTLPSSLPSCGQTQGLSEMESLQPCQASQVACARADVV